MKDTNHYDDDWRSLCELASKERDPEKLLELISKINRVLEECRQHTEKERASHKVDTDLRREATDDCHSFPGQPSLGALSENFSQRLS